MSEIRQEQLVRSVMDIAVEAWRFHGVFERMLSLSDPAQARRYVNQYAWFLKKVEKALQEAGLRMVSVEGQLFDPGMAVTALNIDEFDAEDELYVQQMVEPILMDETSVRRMGVVMLGRKEE